METKQALASQDWLNISSETVLEFLKMDCLNIDEANLLRALISWGKYQTRQSGDDAVENLRSEILPGLQNIRFGSFTQLEVAQLCEEELGEVLTAEEKYSILKSLIKGDWKVMPSGVVSSSKLAPRRGPQERYTFCPLLFNEIPLLDWHNVMNVTWALDFNINKKATFIGVKLNLPACLHDTLTSIKLYTLLKDTIIVSSTADPKSTSLHTGDKCYKITSPQTLAAHTKYTISFGFTPSEGGFPPRKNKGYSLPRDNNPSCSDGLILSVLNAHKIFRIHVQGFVFDKVRASP
jgi:BTB And C-terminal Kelch